MAGISVRHFRTCNLLGIDLTQVSKLTASQCEELSSYFDWWGKQLSKEAGNE